MFNDRHDDCEEFSFFGNYDEEFDSRYQKLYRGCEVNRGEYGYSDIELAQFLAEHKAPNYSELYFEDNLKSLLKEVQNTKFFYVCNYKGEAEGQEVMVEIEAMKLPEFNDDF